MIDEDGETPTFEPTTRDGLVLSYRVGRMLPGYRTDRGFEVPGMLMVLETTQGDFAFYLTRLEAARFSNDIRECTADG